MILNDRQIVREFVTAKRMFLSNKVLLQNTKSLLGSSHSFEDMAFVVSQVENKLTPEEQSLLLINANLVSTSTNSDKVEFPEVISVESLIETSNKTIVVASDQFSEIWNNLTTMTKSIIAINTTTLVEISKIQEFCLRAISDSHNEDTKPDSIMTLSNTYVELPSHGLFSDTSSQDYINDLNNYCDYARNRVGRSTVKTISSIKDLITEGMCNFSKKSIRLAKTDLQNYKVEIQSAVNVSQEEIKQDSSSLVTTVVAEQTNDIMITKVAKLVHSVPINSETLKLVYKQLQNNLDLIELCNKSCELMLDDDLDQSVVAFRVNTQKFLINLTASSRTKDIIKSYCDLFVQCVNTSNQEIAFMLSTTQFIICFNELLVDVIKHISPSTKLEAA